MAIGFVVQAAEIVVGIDELLQFLGVEQGVAVWIPDAFLQGLPLGKLFHMPGF